MGENTDAPGFLAPLAGDDLERAEALVLGAGGAARAVAAALAMKGCRHARFASPSGRSQAELARDFGFEAVPWERRYDYPATLIINATPLGMKGKLEDETPYDFGQGAAASGIAYDLIYNPLETRFLREARARGFRTISGLPMFVAQASLQFKLWTGLDLPAGAERLLREALAG